MMEMAKVTSKGQITIPISIRRRLGINEGDKLLFIDKPEGVMMVNPDMLAEDQADIAAQPAEYAAPTPVVASMKKIVAAPAPVTAAEPDAESAEAANESYSSKAEPAPQEERRPIPPPVEEPEKPEPSIDGLNLGTLLDDIRSIGSNI